LKEKNKKTGKSELNKENNLKLIPSHTARNLDFVKKKIQSGFYDLPTVKIFVAEKIVQSLTY